MRFRLLHNEQGVILVIALVFVFILAIAGTMAYQMTSNELMIAGNFDSSKKAFYAADAGIEEARAALGLPSTNPPGIDSNAIYDPATAYPDASWTAYILASTPWQTSDDPDYDSGDTNYFPNSGSQTNTSITVNSLQSDLSYWVKIRHKTDTSGNIVYYGFQNPSSGLTIAPFSSSTPTEYRPVDIITSYGSTEKGTRILRAEVAHNPGPPIVAALYAENDVDGDTTSYTVTVSGTDNCTAGDCPFCLNVSKHDIYVYPSSADPQLDDNNPSTPTIQLGDININVSQGIISLKVWETSTSPSGCYNNDYKICSSDSDLTVTNQTGSGILLVQGNLTLEGTTWNGLILATGELTLNGGGSGISIEGAVLANSRVWINDANKGNVTINYNSCAIDAALSSIPLRVMAWDDLSITQ